MKKLLIASLPVFFFSILQGQVRTSILYITGTVSSGEKMLVSVAGTKTLEGNVVTAELNGKKTEARTDNNGHAILDFSAIAGGMASSSTAVIKSFDKNGKLLNTSNTMVQPGSPAAPAPPVLDQLPKNILKGEPITVSGQHLGTDAKLNCGNQVQETLAASDKEMRVLPNTKTGEQLAYAITPNGVSESQKVNVYSLDFSLPKNSIKPKENVQAMVNYESIPVGTKLIFTNVSPQTIKMTIPGATNTANECIYKAAEQNGTIPVNITGLSRGNFAISLDPVFADNKNDSLPAAGGKPRIRLTSPVNGATIKKMSDLKFQWSAVSGGPNDEYKISIIKLKPNQSEKDAFTSNNVFFTQDKIYNTQFAYPPNAPNIDTGTYAWSIRPVANNGMNKTGENFESQNVFYVPLVFFKPVGTNPPTEPTAPCPPPDKQELWGSHYYPCVVTEYCTTQPGLTMAQQEALDKVIKKIKKLPVVGKGAKLAALIANACSIKGLYNLWIHVEQPYQTYRYDYVCVNGAWVLKNIQQGAVFYSDLGWVRVYLGEGVGTYEINGTESDAEINNAIKAALDNACK